MNQHESVRIPDDRFPDAAADEVRRAVLSGQAHAVERVLAQHPAAAEDVEQALDLIYAEIDAREESHQAPCVTEYVERFPQWAERIERLFEVHEAFRETEAAETSANGAELPDSTFPGSDFALPAGSELPRLIQSRRVGQYELHEEIGSGATGIVFRATQAGLDRSVAIKILRPFGTDEARDRFHGEAELTARLRHPNIVQIYEVGQDAGVDFMSMEILEGGNLAAALGQTAFAPRAAAELIRTLAAAIAAAHDQGIVHRDLKPGNVLLAKDGSPRISDFGLARHLSEEAVRQTRTGAILGTPGYMAPEQARGSLNTGLSADIYSLGAILYELLTGRPPYHGTSVVEILEQMRVVEPTGVRQLRPGVPRDLQTICMKCLERSPADRYASASDLRDDVSRFLDGMPIQARPVSFMERTCRWAVRHKGIAALTVLLLLTSAAGTAGIAWQWLRAQDNLVRAEIAAVTARSAQRDEQQQRRLSDERLYRQQILAADREFQSGAMDVGNRLLAECDPNYRGWEWELLNSTGNSATVELDGQLTNQGQVKVSPNGTLVAALRGSYSDRNNRQVIVWDFETRQQVWKHSQPGMGLSMAFSPDSRCLLISGHGTAILHDARTGDVVKTFPVENRISCWGAAFSPDGKSVAVPDGHTAKLFSVDPDTNWSVTFQGLEKSHGAYAQCFHPDGRIVAIATRRMGVTIHDCSHGTLLAELPAGADTRSVEFSPDGSLLTAAGYGRSGQGVLKVWNCSDLGFEDLDTRFDSSGVRTNMRFSPDGQVLAVWTGTSPVRLMNPHTMQEVAAYPVHAYTHDVAFSPDSRLLVTSGIESLIRIRDRARELRTSLSLSDVADATDFAIHPNGRFVAVVSDLAPNRRGFRIRNLIEVVDLDRWQPVRRLSGHTDTVTCVAYDSTGDLLASGSDDRTVRLWDKSGRQHCLIESHESPVIGVHFLPPGGIASFPEQQRLLSVDRDGHVLIHDAATPEVVADFETGVSGVSHSALHGNRVALATDDGRAFIINADTGQLHEVAAFDSALRCIDFSPSGDAICVGTEDGTVRLLNLTADNITTEGWNFAAHMGAAYSVAFDPTGTRVVSSGQHGLIRILRASSGIELLTLRTASYPGPAFRAMFDPQGRRLLTTSRWTLYEWDTRPAPVISGSTVPADAIQREAIAKWHSQQGGQCEADKNWAGALRHWQRVGELDKDDVQVHARQARCHKLLENWIAAEECYRVSLSVADAHIGQREYATFRATANHELAQLLTTCPDASRRAPLEAVDRAVQALLTSPRYLPYWKTLGAAVSELLRTNDLHRESGG